MTYSDFTNKLADELMRVREEAKKDKMGEGIIAVRQATEALAFFADLMNLKHRGDWGLLLEQVIGSKKSCELQDICKHFKGSV